MLLSRTSRPLRVALFLGMFLAAPALTTSACSDGDAETSSGTPSSSSGGDTCVGGVVIDGVCQAKCDETKCVDQNICVDNACKLTCDAHTDCYPDGSQDCAAATQDDTGAAVQVCEPNGKAPGVGLKCPFGSECDDPAVYNLRACPDGTRCDPSQCGGQTCAVDEEACAGAEGCTIGKCADGSPCTVPACPANECKAMTCLGWSGEADADAYCTAVDCKADADCPGGYKCEIVRLGTNICGTDKGDEDPCLDPANFGDDGATYQEGPVSLLRNMCVKRTSCESCESDLDCSAIEGQKCADIAGEKVCTRVCAADADCTPEYQCDTGASLCVPRFGACRGTGQFCEPCTNDLDCGPGTGTVYCETFDNGGGCIDAGFPFTCTTDADCPTAPGGKSAECLDEGEGLSPGDSVYHRCYVPFDAAQGKFGCW